MFAIAPLPVMSFMCTSGKRPGHFAKYATGSRPAFEIQYRSSSIFTSLGSHSASRMS